MDEATRAKLYDDGYMCDDGTPNPHPTGSDAHAEWQKGYDESICANAQNLPSDHPDVLRLGCGYYG